MPSVKRSRATLKALRRDVHRTGVIMMDGELGLFIWELRFSRAQLTWLL